MSRRSLTSGLTWMLLVMFLITSTAPSALAHTHAGWETPGAHHRQVHEPKAACKHHCRHADAPVVTEHPLATRHLHVLLFGLEFTVPAPSEPSGNPAEESDPNAAMVSLVVENVILVNIRNLELLLLLPVESPCIAVVARKREDAFSSTPADSTSLCDVARHLRSGVHLI
jgi:hypothetical protein